MHTVRMWLTNIQRALSTRENVLISRKEKTGASIKHHWIIIEWACNVVQGGWSRKENIKAILVAGPKEEKNRWTVSNKVKGMKMKEHI